MSLVRLVLVQYHGYLEHHLRSGYKATLAQLKTIVSSLILSVRAFNLFPLHSFSSHDTLYFCHCVSLNNQLDIYTSI